LLFLVEVQKRRSSTCGLLPIKHGTFDEPLELLNIDPV
jgi:hypothetical protein